MERFIQLYEKAPSSAQTLLAETLLHELETFLYNVRCYSFPQHQEEPLDKKNLLFEVADYLTTFPKHIQMLLEHSLSKEVFLSYIEDLHNYYLFFSAWHTRFDNSLLEKELLQNVLNNQKELKNRLRVS